MSSKIIVLSQGPHHIAVFKPHNLAVIGGAGVPRPTLLDLVRQQFGASIFPVHRLDRVTSGITIFARSIFARHAIENAFKKRLVKKIYYALCEGQPNFTKLIVDEPLKKINLKNKSGPVAKQIVDPAGEKSITNFVVKKNYNSRYCLIEAQPVSGRMHQIRAHLAYIGLPIVGDRLYGAKTSAPPHTIALSAIAISLPLPKGKPLHLDVRDIFEQQQRALLDAAIFENDR